MKYSPLFLFLFFCSSCYVNKGIIDPWSYAPLTPSSYWLADMIAQGVRCEAVEESPLPDAEHILSLAEVIDIALLNNPQTKISWAEARSAAAAYGQSQSPALPNITGEMYYSNYRTPYLSTQLGVGASLPGQTLPQQTSAANTLVVVNESQWGPQTTLTYTIFDFGQNRFTSQAARYALYFTNYTHNRTLQTLVEDVTQNYYNSLYQKRLLEANEADLNTALETLAAAELSLSTGVKDISDVLQARTQALLAEITLSQQHQSLNTANALLLDTMGLPANAPFQLQSLPIVNPEKLELEPLCAFIAAAVQARPDLLAARSNVHSKENSLNAAKKLFFPTLVYALEFGKTFFNGGFHDNYDYTSTFTLSAPIFTGFSIRNQIKAAQANLQVAEATLRQAELAVFKELTTAYSSVEVAFDTLRAANKFLSAAKEQYEVSISQYRAGTNTILDVTSAQSSLFDARAKQAQALQQWFTSLTTLQYSTGTLSLGALRKK